MLTPMSSEYHHGDLPSALRGAAVELISEKGPNGFSLREVARRAGVSHAAPAHHFGDARGLLTSVATEGFNVLCQNMQALDPESSARQRFIDLGTTYVQTALANPGHYGVMVGHDYTDEDDEPLLVASLAAYDVLLDTMRGLRAEYNPDLDDNELEKTAVLVWASVHGLVEMAPILGHLAESTSTDTGELRDLIVRFADMVIAGIKA